jgi:hypothetical protein
LAFWPIRSRPSDISPIFGFHQKYFQIFASGCISVGQQKIALNSALIKYKSVKRGILSAFYLLAGICPPENGGVQRHAAGKAALFALKFLVYHGKIKHEFCFIGDSPT